jgi:hypothetical protein
MMEDLECGIEEKYWLKRQIKMVSMFEIFRGT